MSVFFKVFSYIFKPLLFETAIKTTLQEI